MNDGAVRGVFASPGHPVSRGRLCVRGWHIHELLATGDRITAPLVRKEGRFEPVSYDEAVAQAAERLSRYSGDEIGFLASPRASNEDNFLMARLARDVFHTNNIGLASDQGHGAAADVLCEGAGMPAMLGTLTEIRKAGLILVVGADITRLNPIVGSEIHLAARNGADLVTLSSRRTQIAGLSRKHLWLRPGTIKPALAALAKVMIQQGGHDPEFVRNRTEGYEAFVRSLETIDLAGIEAGTGLPLAEIEDLARRLSEARSAMAFFTSGIAGLDHASVALLYDLFLAAGKIGREGCGVNPVTGVCNIVGSYDVGAGARFLPGYRRAGGSDPGRTPRELLAMTPTPLKAVVVADRDEEIVRHAAKIKGLECVVYIGAYANAFTDFAHIVLPAATFAEADGTYTNAERRIQLNRRKVDPPPGVLPAWRVYADIAARRGAARTYASAEDVMADIAASVPAYSAVTYPKLEKGFGLQWPCRRRPSRGNPPPVGRRAVRQVEVRPRGGGFPRSGRLGSVSAPPHGRQGQLFLAHEQHHEENPYPQTGIQRPAPPLPEGLRGGRGRRRGEDRRPGSFARQRRLGRRLDAGRGPGVRGRQAGHGLRPLLHRGHGPRLPERLRRRGRRGPGFRHPRSDREGVTMYILPKKESLRMIAALAEDYDLYGPVLQDVSGEPLFDRALDPADVRLDAAIPYNPPKGVLFPQSERILSYSYDRESREASIRRDDLVRPKALVGLRSCDLNGLLCLDRFFLGQEFVDDVYLDHRKKMFIVANTCVRPFPQCFCVCTDSGPSAREGFDVNLTEAGDDYLFEAGSEKGEALAKKLGLKEAGPDASARKGRIVDASIARFDAEATENKAWISRVVNRITTGFIGNEVWEYIGDQCFECGACAFVCPTCSCFNIEDVASGAGAPTGCGAGIPAPSRAIPGWPGTTTPANRSKTGETSAFSASCPTRSRRNI